SARRDAGASIDRFSTRARTCISCSKTSSYAHPRTSSPSRRSSLPSTGSRIVRRASRRSSWGAHGERRSSRATVHALITGAGGFVGSVLARAFADSGAKVSAVYRKRPPIPAPGVEAIHADLASADRLPRAYDL